MPEGESLAAQLARTNKLVPFYYSLSEKERTALRYNWDFWKRPKQTPPPHFFDSSDGYNCWFLSCGRGFGKSKCGAETIRWAVESNKIKHFGIAAPTHNDVILNLLESDDSGLLKIFPPGKAPKFNSQKKLLTFHNGATARIFSGEEPQRQRGPNLEFMWMDEFAAFNYLEEFYLKFSPALRKGIGKLMVTTTPTSHKIIDMLAEDPCAIFTFGGMTENADNLTKEAITRNKFLYSNSDLAAQELEGQLLGQSIGAIFKKQWIVDNRVDNIPPGVKIIHKIVSVDPSGSGSESACECGIIVAGKGSDGKGYLLKDYSLKASAADWCQVAYKAFIENNAAYILYETNFGGKEYVPEYFKLLNLNINNRFMPVHADSVAHGKNAKAERAKSVSPMVQNGNIKFVGEHRELENQLTTWTQDKKSPDRMDAFVHAFRYLLVPKPTVNRDLDNLFPQ